MDAKLGRYEIEGEVGRGAMGVVYKALDPVLGRTVAIKTIGMSHDPKERAEYEARFYQEARAAGSLAHPNIVTIHDVGNSGNTAYMAMEFLDGEELGKQLSAAALGIERAVDIAAQIAAGLAYAHERGIVHRDVKPANIMVLGDGRVKITDFGIARMRSSEVKTQTGMLLGSPRYMPPEVFLGKRADARSDVFSLGIILYEMLTGMQPFSGDSVSALMYQTINSVPPAPSAVRPGVPPMLDFIVAKTLAKDPDERYRSAADLERDLQACLQSTAASAGGTTTVPRAALATGGTSELADTNQREQLLAQTLPLERSTDALADATPPAATLGISRAFDSMAATGRLAARLGMHDGEATTTVKMVAPAGTLQPRRPVAASQRTGWTGREVAIFAAGTVVALVVAAAIIVM